MFSCEYCEIFKNSFFIEHLQRLLLNWTYKSSKICQQHFMKTMMKFFNFWKKKRFRPLRIHRSIQSSDLGHWDKLITLFSQFLKKTKPHPKASVKVKLIHVLILLFIFLYSWRVSIIFSNKSLFVFCQMKSQKSYDEVFFWVTQN